ncbi:MAG: GAF domain-containing protein [Chloroflexi bacterium]|nr:GAF domain-containing protein [Chloroflexota bacterium]
MLNNNHPTLAQLLPHFVESAARLQAGDYDLDLPAADHPELVQLGDLLQTLADRLQQREQELRWLDQMTTCINDGMLLEEILDNIYQDFHDLIPYQRIGVAFIADDGVMVRSHWVQSDQPVIRLKDGYTAPLAGSSLETIIQTGQPRILNDLRAYLRQKPASKSTRLIVDEGFQSSLTCPLIANNEPIGFIFFSSIEPHIYDRAHINSFQRIAGQLSVAVEKGRLVSELAHQNQAIEAQNNELIQLSELKNTFLGIAAHDLRSPLGTIQMGIHLMQDPSIDLSGEELHLILHDMGLQTSHMLRLINELLDVTQIEAGQLELEREAIDLGAFLHEAVSRHAQLAQPKGTQVLFDNQHPTDDAEHAIVMADPQRLRQVIDNLLSNAVKFSPPDSTVRVFAEKAHDQWRIDVADEGPGIRPEEREHLFQDFAKLSARPTGGEPSTGLGLAITRRIVEAHGGIIDVDSQPGAGTVFWFTLPT